MRIGIIARSDNTGLGNQTLELANMLNPFKIMLIDFSKFNQNKQHHYRYSKYNCSVINGYPSTFQIRRFLVDLDVVISCETFYNDDLVLLAKRMGIKTVLQYNYELFNNLQNPNAPLPNILLSPSMWNIDVVNKAFGKECLVKFLPPPTNKNIFENAKQNNTSKRHNRILHIAGKKAAKDRNGTDTVLEMLKYSKADYELVIKAQAGYELECNDPRVTIEYGNPDNREDMYDGFDAMVLPRRYAGLCLPMNEALISGLPVFMTDISPNNLVLPKEWLVPAKQIDVFKAKTAIEVYEADPERLAEAIDKYMVGDSMVEFKDKAIEIGSRFYPENLIDQYLEILG